MRHVLFALVASTGLVACETLIGFSGGECQPELELVPASAEVGGTVRAFGGPFLLDGQVGRPERNVQVSVDGTPAPVIEVASVDRLGRDVAEACTLCFECRVRADCAACGACDGAALPEDDVVEGDQTLPGRASCFGDPSDRVPDTADTGIERPLEAVGGYCGLCEQQVTFTVPDVSAGARPVVVSGPFGVTPDRVLEVSPGSDDTGDTGDTADTADTGTPVATGDTAGATGTGDTGSATP